jgi:Flp pilus assembly protein TadG
MNRQLKQAARGWSFGIGFPLRDLASLEANVRLRSPVRLHQRGQILVLFALLAPFVMGMLGLGIDFAFALGQHEQAQKAADLAALSGIYCYQSPTQTLCASAQSYPGAQANGSSSAQTAATGMALATAAVNGFTNGSSGVTVTVNLPYHGNTSQLQVIVWKASPTFFLNVLGIGSLPVSAQAIADHPNGYGIFAGDTDCANPKSIDWSGSSVTVTGNVNTNSTANISGGHNSISGAFTYTCASGFTSPSPTTRSAVGQQTPRACPGRSLSTRQISIARTT